MVKRNKDMKPLGGLGLDKEINNCLQILKPMFLTLSFPEMNVVDF